MSHEKYLVKVLQYEAAYNTVSEEAGIRQCANCRWFNRTAVYQTAGCQVIEEHPLPIEATGLCLRHEPIPEEVLPHPPEPMEVEVMNLDTLEFTPTEVRGLKDRLLKRKDRSGITFSKAADGLRTAIIVTSNGYQDREYEHVATKALQRYVDDCYDDQGEWVGDNVLDFWHDKQLNNIGAIIAANMIDGFLVEIAKERSHPVVKAIWDYWQTTSNEGAIIWGASHQFTSTERGVYTNIRKSKTSILPIEAAANLGTAGEIIK